MERRLVAITVSFLALALVPSPAAADAPAYNLTPDVYPVTSTPGIATGFVVYALNAGSVTYTGDVEVQAYYDGLLLETFRIPTDAESFTNATIVPTAGVHRVELRIDTKHEVPETDETDNVLAYDVLFTPDHPDLVADAPAVRVTGWPQSHTEIDVRVCNVGTGDAGARTLIWGILRPDVTVSASPSLGGDFLAILPELKAGACLVHTFRDDEDGWLGNGRYEFHTQGYFTGREPVVFETRYDNNAATGSILYSPLRLL